MRSLTLCVIGLALCTPRATMAQQDPLAGRTKGAPTAPVTVYEMSDFQCPFCKEHTDQVFPALEREYIQSGKVKWVFINFPLTSIHPNAVAAAEFAMCALREEAFWPAHDILFRTQRTWAPLRSPGPYFGSLVDSLGLDRAAMTSCLQSGATQQEIRSDAAGAQQSGARSTPTFYIEGGMMLGVIPIPTFRRVLDSIYSVKSQAR